jgi:nucleotide sugar dehydrogenase
MNAPEPDLLASVSNRAESVVVWGAGFIGLSAACALAVADHPTVVVDTDDSRVAQIAAGTVPLPGFEDRIPLAEALTRGLRAVNPDDPVVAGRIHLVCVTTDHDGKPVTEPLTTVLTTLAGVLAHREALIVIESTVSPQWLDEVVLPLFPGAAYAHVHFATAPRRDWMLSPDMNLRTLPRVVGARHEGSRALLTALYDTISDTVHVASDWRHAALTKPVENLFRFVDLVLTNQLAEAFPGLDVPEVLRLAGTKWNVQVFHPSIGIGGYCIPLSPLYTTDGVPAAAAALPLVSAALTWNDTHPSRVAEAILAVADGPIGILGLSYAPDARITKGSPVALIAAQLLARGADVRVHDPYFTPAEVTELTGAAPLAWPQDADQIRTLLIATHHTAYADLAQRLAQLEKPPTVLDSLGVLREDLAGGHLPYAEWGTPAAPSAAQPPRVVRADEA